jgi:lactoylglutathione lyase
MHLYETHLPVADTRIAESFYREVVGLPFAHRDPTRDIVFLWADEKQRGMIGLWGASTGYGRLNGVLTPCHLAFAVSFEELQCVIGKLNERRIQTRGFKGNLTCEPSVIGWMPSAQIYFRDPDGHSLEFISLLPEPPIVDFIGTYAEWKVTSRSPIQRGGEVTKLTRPDRSRCG